MKRLLLSFISKVVRFIPGRVKNVLYQLGPLSQLIRQILNYFSPEGLSIMTIASGRFENLQMYINMKTEKDYWLGTYEAELQEMIYSLVKEGWVAYDVGANIGYFSLLLANSVGSSGKVFAFEAMPENIGRLNSNLKLNMSGSRVNVFPGAVLNKSKVVQFLIGPSGAMGKVEGSIGRVDLHEKSIEVTGISLDDFVYRDGNPPPDVIKMDIEGGEVLAIEGMTNLLEEMPPLIFIEIHGKDAAKKVWEKLTAFDYAISEMKPDLPIVTSWEELDWKSYLVAIP